jgi:hypothetical protein
MKFRKRPVVIEAIQWTGSNVAEVDAFFDDGETVAGAGTAIVIDTLEGAVTAQVGDWIIRGVAGKFYPCKPDIFEATYEPAGDLA